jgi:hypothetical protein
LHTSDLVSAMSTDHQTHLFDTFQYRGPLFNEVCHGRSEPRLDVWEAVPAWETDLDAARYHAFQVAVRRYSNGLHAGRRQAAVRLGVAMLISTQLAPLSVVS